VGERTRRVYRLGDRLQVRVVRVDLDERKIDFELAESEAAGADRGGRPRRGRRRPA
jgi:ribonuclease R